MRPYNFVDSGEGIQALKSDKLQAVIVNDVILGITQRQFSKCYIQNAGRPFYREESSFALPKGSQWNQPISQLLRDYKESGLLANFETDWLKGECNENIGKDKTPQFGLRYLSGACVMLMTGFVLSLCIFVLECCVKR